MRKRLFILGGTGFIGSEITALAKDSFEVLVGSRGKRKEFTCWGCNHVAVDVMKPDTLKDAVAWADFIVDASTGIPPHVENPELEGLLPKLLASYQVLFNLALGSGIEKFVFISSGGTIYGDSSLPNSESTVLNPLSSYSLSKILLETTGIYFANRRGLPFVAVRPSNPYGHRQVGCESGVGLIGKALHCALNRSTLKIYGDGSCIRDFLAVDDLARGIISALIYGNPSDIFNLGSGVGCSVNYVVDEIQKRLGPYNADLKVAYTDDRTTDLKNAVLDCSKAHRQIFWQASTSLESGLDRVIKEVFK